MGKRKRKNRKDKENHVHFQEKRRQSVGQHESSIGKFIWIKIPGVSTRVLWPVKVMAQTQTHVEIYIKSDDAQFAVKKPDGELQPFHENLESLKAQGIEYMQAKGLRHTEQCFLTDIEWALNDIENKDSVADRTGTWNTDEDRRKSDDLVTDENYIPENYDGEFTDDIVVDRTDTRYTNEDRRKSEDLVTDETCMPETYGGQFAEDSVVDRTDTRNTDEDRRKSEDLVPDKHQENYDQEFAEDIVVDRTDTRNTDEDRRKSEDLVPDKHPENYDQEFAEDIVVDRTDTRNTDEDRRKSEDLVADKHPEKYDREFVEDIVVDRTDTGNTDEDRRKSEDLVTGVTCMPENYGGHFVEDILVDRTDTWNTDEDRRKSEDLVADKHPENYDQEFAEDIVVDRTDTRNTDEDRRKPEDLVDDKHPENYDREFAQDIVVDRTDTGNTNEDRRKSEDLVTGETFMPENYDEHFAEDIVVDRTDTRHTYEDRRKSEDLVTDKHPENYDWEETSESEYSDDSFGDKTYYPENSDGDETEFSEDIVSDRSDKRSTNEDRSKSDDNSTYKHNDEHVSDSVESDGEVSCIFPSLSGESRCVHSSVQHQENVQLASCVGNIEKQYDSDASDDSLDEDSILRDTGNPDIYISRVLTSYTTKTGKAKKSSRVYNSYQYCCPCKMKVSNWAQHLNRNTGVNHAHQSCDEIQTIREENDKTKKKILLGLLRAKFNHNFNMMTIKKGKGEILLERRPTTVFWLKDYGPCPNCLFWYAKKLLRKHQHSCIKKKPIPQSIGDLTTQSECLSGFLTPIASKRLRREVFSKMRVDDVSEVVKQDLLIVQLGNQWLEKNIGNVLKRGVYTSQILRLVGRFFLNLTKVKPLAEDKPEMWDYLKPAHFDAIVDACILTASPLDEDDNGEDTLQCPSNAIKLGYDIKRLLSGKIGLSIIHDDPQSQEHAEKMLKLMEIYWSSRVTKAARVILEKRKYYAEKNLPVPEDIMRLNEFLRDSISQLDYKDTSSQNFKHIAKLIEAKLVVYNRRRTGEIQAIGLKDYSKRCRGVDGAHLMGQCTEFERKLLESQEVMTVRGKVGRAVPVILPCETQQGLVYLAEQKVRKEAGVSSSNPYLFASQGESIVWAYDAVRSAAESAQLQNAAAITSTNMRKYMATVTQVFDLKENQMQWVLNHLGHTMDVHKIHYRATSDIIERAQIAKLLILQDQGRVGEFQNQRLEDIQLEDVVFQDHVASCPNENGPEVINENLLEGDFTSPEIVADTLKEAEMFNDYCDEHEHKKPRKKPSNVKKVYWSKEEEEEIKHLFRHFFEKKIRPKPRDCLKAILKSKKENGYIQNRKKDVLKKKIFRMIDKIVKK